MKNLLGSTVSFFGRLALAQSPARRFALVSAASQVFPLLVLPFLARLYSPQAFGEYAIYYALTTICSVVLPLSLHYAVLTERSENDASATALLTCAVALSLSPLGIFAVWLTHQFGFVSSSNSLSSALYWLIPTSAVLTVWFQVGYNWILRRGDYARLGRYKVMLALVTSVAQVSIGFAHFGASGLVAANLIGLGLAGLIVWRHVGSQFLLAHYSFSIVVNQLVKLKQLIVYTTPGGVFNSVALYLPELLIGRFYGSDVLGQYSMAQKLVATPLSFISTAIQDIFRSEVTKEFRATGGTSLTYARFLKILLILSVGILTVLFLLSSFLFDFLLGAQWNVAGAIVQALGILVVIKFINGPLSFVQFSYGRYKFDFFWQTGLIVVAAGGLILPYTWHAAQVTPVAAIWYFSFGMSCWYLISLAFSTYLGFKKHASI